VLSASTTGSKKRKRKSITTTTTPAQADGEDENGEDGDDSGNEDSTHDGWRKTRDGTSLVKRVRKHLIRKPIEKQVEPDPLTASSLPQQNGSSPLLNPAPSTASQRLPTCDGPGVALLLYKLVDAFEDVQSLERETDMAYRCCDRCRPKTLEALHYLKNQALAVRSSFGQDQSSSV
jgi:hypothetical protein